MQLIRGDTFKFKFRRIDAQGAIIKNIAPNLFFTVKRNAGDKNYIFQKTLQDGISFDEDWYYHVTVEPEDTNNMKFGDYVYDIEVIAGEYKQTISKGVLSIDTEVTWAINEG